MVLPLSVKVLAKRGDPLLTFYSYAALILSGVYFPLEQLPSFLRPLSYLIVHTYVISGLRHALLEDPSTLDGPGPVAAAGTLFLASAVLIPIAVYAFHRAMQYGRKMGLLSGY